MHVNEKRVAEIATLLKAKAPARFYDFSVEIPSATDPEVIANYVGAVVALDYGFWRINNKTFEVDFYPLSGQKVKGSTFLWSKSKPLLTEKPAFFTAQHLQNLSEEDYVQWLSDDSGNVPFKDASIRLKLIRNYGQILASIGGSLHQIYCADHSLANILTTMEKFEAYRDFPLYKKAHLLCKILQRIKQWMVIESPLYPKIPPIDYHLMNLAWKLGLVEITLDLEELFTAYAPLPSIVELTFRLRCADAYLQMSKLSGIDAYNIDDIMWMESRKNCQLTPYCCSECLFNTVCQKNKQGFPVINTYRY